jgi:hypothetical protein
MARNLLRHFHFWPFFPVDRSNPAKRPFHAVNALLVSRHRHMPEIQMIYINIISLDEDKIARHFHLAYSGDLDFGGRMPYLRRCSQYRPLFNTLKKAI